MRYETPLDGSLLLLQKVAHKKSSLASSLLDAESFEQAVHVLDLGNSNSLIYVLGPLTVGVLASAVLMEVFSWSKRFEVGLLGLRSLWLLLAVLATVDMSILIPISYDIAQQLGHGALASGILVAASQAFQPVLALVSRWLVIGKSYQYQRRFMLCCFGAEAVLTWLMVPVFEACNHWSNQTVLYALVFLRAMTGGVLMLYGVPLSTCVYDSSPLEDRSQLSIKFYLCLSIGVCVGPFVSSIMLTLHQGGAHDSCYTGRQSISVLGFVWAVAAVLATTFLPYDLEDTKPLVETPEEAAESAQALSLAQVEYSWTPEQIGYVLTGIFLITAFVGAFIWLLRKQVSDFVLMMGMAMISISGAVLFVDFGGSTGGHSSPWLLMLADVTVYSCMFQLTAFMEGIATEAALPGSTSYCSLENYVVMRNLAIQIPRALGPPVARALIDSCGRNTYAVLQLCLSSVAISGVWFAAKTARSDAVSKHL